MIGVMGLGPDTEDLPSLQVRGSVGSLIAAASAADFMSVGFNLSQNCLGCHHGRGIVDHANERGVLVKSVGPCPSHIASCNLRSRYGSRQSLNQGPAATRAKRLGRKSVDRRRG